MPIDPSQFRILPGLPVDLAKRPTRVEDLYHDGDDYRDHLEKLVKQLSDLQRTLYADDRYAILAVFQAMDAAGKDGTIRHVLSGVNPQGCQVFSFKQPSLEELDHDFLWRTTKRLPERGRIGVFNRSHYEEVLVVRVHPEYLVPQRLGDLPADMNEFWDARYRSVRDHEAHLHRSGTRMVKFFLHMSPEEQRQRFLDRLNEPDKNWKFSAGDVAERQLWPKYMAAYQQALAATSTENCPWYAIPADDKKNARLLVAEVLVRLLESLDLRTPSSDTVEIEKYRELLS